MNISSPVDEAFSFILSLPPTISTSAQSFVENASLNSNKKISTMKDLSHRIRLLFAKFKDLCPDTLYPHIYELLQLCEFDEKEWKPYAHFSRWTYSRNLIDQAQENFHLLLLCWGPHQKSQIHDHNGAHCCMKVLHGSLIESRFDSETLKSTQSKTLKLNEVAYIHDSIGLHCIANPSDSPAISLHVYFPPINECQIYNPITMHAAKSLCTTYRSAHGVLLPNFEMPQR